MTTTTYKGYTIKTVGIGQSIYRPGQDLTSYAPGYVQSMAAAKRWINEDIQKTHPRNANRHLTNLEDI